MLIYKLNFILPLVAVLGLAFASSAFAKGDDGTISTTGRIVFNDLEGGFYAILGDNGGRYDPINLPKDFQKASTRVRVVLRPKPDMMSFHMWGTIVEIVKIEKVAAPVDPKNGDEDKKESPADRLRKTPTKITVGDVELSLESHLIRNLMPTVGPRRGSNSYLIVDLNTKDDALPEGLKCKTIYGVDGQKIWESSKLEVRSMPKKIRVIARNTPDWQKPIDVILKFSDSKGKEHMLRISSVEAMKVY